MPYYSFVVFVAGHDEIELPAQGILLDHGSHAFNALVDDVGDFTAMLEARGVTITQRNCLEPESFDAPAFFNEPGNLLVGPTILDQGPPADPLPDAEAHEAGPSRGDLDGDATQPPADPGDAGRPDG